MSFEIYPDPSAHPPATSITPEDLRHSEEACKAMRAALESETDVAAKEQIAIVLMHLEEQHRAMCQLQVDQLRRIHFDNFYRRFLGGKR